MRMLPLLIVFSTQAQTFNVQPSNARQGDAVRLSTVSNAVSARLNGKTIRLFDSAGGGRLGLMPVSANYKPGSYDLEFLHPGGGVLHTAVLTVRDAKFPEQNVQLSSSVQELKPAPGEMEKVRQLRDMVSEVRYWNDSFTRPVPGCMVSPFGVRRLHNRRPTGAYHGGIDQRGRAGTPIRAIAAGVVRIVQPFNVHGLTVGIDHGQGVTSLYLHMSNFAVAEGLKVAKGDVIGYIGSTGRSTAPHLHWAVAVNGVGVNPERWVPLEPCFKPKAANRRGARRR